ncbi:glycosyltransferase [Actinomycetes bacterium KLBMP 9797]
MLLVRGHVAGPDKLRVLSLYEGFFAGGARVLHSAVVAGLQAGGAQQHSVLSIHRAMRRETMVQKMENDSSYQLLRGAGVPVSSLIRRFGGTGHLVAISAAAHATAARHAARADVILSLKEQPLRLINQVGFPRTPVIACLHRSDPENQQGALDELRTAVADGRIAAIVCCAESTRAAYQAAGIPGSLLHVIPNGVDLERFRPAPGRVRGALRRSLALPARAKVIAFAARYDGMKNVPLFLAAARVFLTRERTGHVLMCGAGMNADNADLRRDIETCFAGASALLPRLRLLGLRPDMPSVYAAADVVALTSRVGEAAPLCLIEGAMCGAVPVTTDVGDAADIVAGLGFVTPPDPEAIATAWTAAADRRAELAPVLAASRERFSQTRMIAAYAGLITMIRASSMSV